MAGVLKCCTTNLAKTYAPVPTTWTASPSASTSKYMDSPAIGSALTTALMKAARIEVAMKQPLERLATAEIGASESLKRLAFAGPCDKTQSL